MFMLYAIAFGLVVGLALGGTPHGLARLRFHWAPVALVGLAGQIVLFSTPLTAIVGDSGAAVYVASSAMVFAVVLRNSRVPGLSIVALGAASNLAAIVTNGGWMPANPAALAAVGKTIGVEYSNSREFTAPALAALTDLYGLPQWVPFANVFSVGDVLIGAGVFVAIVVAMRAEPRNARRTAPHARGPLTVPPNAQRTAPPGGRPLVTPPDLPLADTSA